MSTASEGQPRTVRVLIVDDDEAHAELAHPPIAVLEHLGEVVAGVDVHHREREPGGGECLDGDPLLQGGDEPCCGV